MQDTPTKTKDMTEMPEESPKKTRARATAEADVGEAVAAPKTKRRAAPAAPVTESAPADAVAEPKRPKRAKKAPEADQLALPAAPPPVAFVPPPPPRDPPPPAREVVVAPPPAPPPPRIDPPIVIENRSVESAPQPTSAPAPSGGNEAPPPQSSNPQGQNVQQNGQPNGAQGQNRHHRNDRFRNRHERHGQGGSPQNQQGGHGGQPQNFQQPQPGQAPVAVEGASGEMAPQQDHGGQPPQQGGQPQQHGGNPQQHHQQNRHGGQPQQFGGQPHQQGGQPGQPGQQGHGRRRRRRGRGGGGGGGGQPGQPGQQGQPGQNPGQESQLQPVVGVLEMDERGAGRLRKQERAFQAMDNDPDVPKQMVDRFRLRPGALINASAFMRNGRLQVQRVDAVEGVPPDEASNRMTFTNLTSMDPDRRIILETGSGELLTRVIDVITPIGFGQRGLIVAPPKTGKTIILQKIAKAVMTNHPKAKLMVLLIDERPEEVTDFKRSIGADVYASSADRPAHEHLRLAEMAMERARRLVEGGDDVVVLLDSITRLARAFNKEIESSGRTMSGGVDSRALERPKRLFGAARNTEEAGSLTIIATALIDTGSRMDEVIFEEFKGTGNMELVLDRQLAERRLWPAINVNGSGTRKEEKLFSVKENEKVRKLRAYLAALRPIEAMEKLLGRIRDFRSNAEFFEAI